MVKQGEGRGMVRYAAWDDLEAIVDIYNSSIPGRASTADVEPVTLESRREWFASHEPQRHPIWVFEQNAQVVGWLSLNSFYGRPAYSATAEVSVYVAPGHQRQGAGGALLHHALTEAPRLGIHCLLGFVFAHNPASLGLFHRSGFEDWGYLPEVNRLDGIWRDVVIVGRHVG